MISPLCLNNNARLLSRKIFLKSLKQIFMKSQEYIPETSNGKLLTTHQPNFFFLGDSFIRIYKSYEDTYMHEDRHY